jgi:hypothetical protein
MGTDFRSNLWFQVRSALYDLNYKQYRKSTNHKLAEAVSIHSITPLGYIIYNRVDYTIFKGWRGVWELDMRLT